MNRETPDIVQVEAEEDVFVVDFANRWRLYVPYEWYGRLRGASPSQRQHFTFNVKGIHWPEVDEDLSGKGLIADVEARCGDREDYHRWFCKKIDASLNDPRPGLPHDQVMAEMDALMREAESVSKNR